MNSYSNICCSCYSYFFVYLTELLFLFVQNLPDVKVNLGLIMLFFIVYSILAFT